MDEAEHAYRNPDEIERLKALIAALPADRRVTLVLRDGTTLTGIVGERPVLQIVRGEHGEEGANALLRLEGDAPGRPDVRDLWIEQIVEIRAPGTEADAAA